MAEKRALIVTGGWEGHEPQLVGTLFEELLRSEGFHVDREAYHDGSFASVETIAGYDLLVPSITMSQITGEQSENVSRAMAEHGTGMAGSHGGMCDAFRTDCTWQFITGGQFVGHPGNDGTPYTIRINREHDHEITRGLSDFQVSSEQYYMHVDPAITVLASTDFPNPAAPGPHSGNPCSMPQVWTKTWGKARVFFNALGHVRKVFEDVPEAKELMRRGFLWASR